MALRDDQIRRYNPWWVNPGWEGSDEELVALAAEPIQLPTPLVDQLDIRNPGLNTIRGPRQVGKSTLLKLLVRRALGEGRTAGDVIYLTLDLLQHQPLTELDASVARAKELSGAGRGALVMLDEVTIIEGWDVGVKAMWDSGLLRGDVVVCTGSSSVDLVEGAVERWPGRRGSGDDHLVLPQTFGAFARTLDANVPASPALTVGELVSPAGRDLLRDVRLHDTSLRRSFERYLEFGGLPAAIAEAASDHVAPSRGVKRVFIDSLAREVARHGLSEPAAYALIERIARSLSSEVNWSALGREMDVPLTPRTHTGRGADGQTVRKYVERFAATYFAMVLYAWKGDMVGNDLARDKKLYFGDPILYGVARDVAGVPATDLPAAVENAIAIALFRRYEPEYAQMYGFGMPTRLHSWRSARGTEVDFLAGPRSEIECVEVKYRTRVDRRALSGMLRAFPGRPAVIASKDELELRNDGALIPAHVFAWALG